MKDLFYLNPEITFLNHGSFGACPKPIFEAYQHFQVELEREPVNYITVETPRLLKESRKALANFISCHEDDLVYVQNPSTAYNIVIKNLKLQPGDEILTTDHEYGAMDRTWNYYCRKSGAKYVQQKISLPLLSKEQFIEEFWKGLTPKTKIIFISQITSSTALIFPVKEICDKAKELGLMTIVDGAHVPHHIDLNLSELKADIYTGACHKWMLTPKGCSFLYVKRELQHLFDPLIISWGYEAEFPSTSQFIDYHEYQGTRDSAAFLTVPKALEFLEKNNWTEVKKNCRNFIQDTYAEMCDFLNTKPICKISDEFLGQMCSIPIQTTDGIKLKEMLYNQYKIQIPVMRTNLEFEGNKNQVFIRISANAYTTRKDIETLKSAIRDIKLNHSLIK
ncbi:MAG: aminotransferase class V-fold PLP-dependent enzyme [Crocinitomicaceae bacterium]|nr:aminotransferase class V-fold PLP-dependent enzyme [Crocinitomicaceae bacterium]